MADEPTTPEGEAPSSETGFDAGQWFEAAGIDPQATDPSDIATAREFHSTWGQHEKLYSNKEFEPAVEQRVREYFSDPTTHDVLKAHFKQALAAESVSAKEQEAAGETPEVSSQQVQQLQQMFQQKVGSMESAIGELVKLEQARQKRTETEDWHSKFSKTLEDVVKRGTNGTVDRDAAARELRRRFASGELTDDSPAALKKALTAYVSEKHSERQKWAHDLGLDLSKIEGKPLPPNLSVEDAVGDDDTFDALLGRIVNHGMPPDAAG